MRANKPNDAQYKDDIHSMLL